MQFNFLISLCSLFWQADVSAKFKRNSERTIWIALALVHHHAGKQNWFFAKPKGAFTASITYSVIRQKKKRLQSWSDWKKLNHAVFALAVGTGIEKGVVQFINACTLAFSKKA